MSRRILMRMNDRDAPAALLLDPAADALKRLAADVRAADRVVGLEHTAALRIVAMSRMMAAGAMQRLRDALPDGELWNRAAVEHAVLAGMTPLCADVLEQRAAAWLAVELPARAA
jgi:hypothetical protein